MRPVFMVKNVTGYKIKNKMYNFFNFHFAAMDVWRTAVRSDTFPDCVWLYMNVLRGRIVHVQYQVGFWLLTIFKNSPIKISYTTNNTISRILNPKLTHTKTRNQFDKSWVYQLTCPNCNMKYTSAKLVDHSVNGFKNTIETSNTITIKSNFAMHLIENHNSIGHIDDTMEISHTTNKGPSMDTIQIYHIYKRTKNCNQITDNNTVKPNKVYDVVIHGETDRERTRNINA